MQSERRKKIIQGIKNNKSNLGIKGVNQHGCVIFNADRTNMKNIDETANNTAPSKPNICITYNVENASRRAPVRTR